MKIAFISDQFFPRTSADSEQIISSLSALSKLIDVTLISAGYSSKPNIKTFELEKYYGRKCSFQLEFINHVFKNIRGLEKLNFSVKSAFRTKSSDYDLVYTRNIPVVLSILLFTKLPVIFESYRPWPSRNIFSKWLFKWLSDQPRFLGVVLHSSYAKSSFVKVGFKEKDLFVAHNAFDFSLYEDKQPSVVRKEFDLPEDKIITTYSGRVTMKKGLGRMIELAKSFPNQFFLIIGSENHGEVENKAKNIKNIRILGWLDRKTVFDLLKASDILYIPPTLMARDVSKNTVLPIKTFIYKASATAIFGPASKDIEEVLTHKKNAYLVEPDNWNEEVQGFKELLEKVDLRKQIGTQASFEMKTNTWDKRAEEILGFISKYFN